MLSDQKTSVLMRARIFPRVLLKLIRQLEISHISAAYKAMYVPSPLPLLLLLLCAATTITRLIISIVTRECPSLLRLVQVPASISRVYSLRIEERRIARNLMTRVL